MTYALLNKELARMEVKRNALLDKAASYDVGLLNKKPAADRWSAIQTLDHMISVERAAISYVRKKSQDRSSAGKTGIKQWFRSLLLNMYLGSSKKFGAPANVVPIVTYASLNEMREQWNEVRREVRETIGSIPENLLGHGWFKHPSVGKLNLMQMITFLEAHYDRHEKQVWRTLKEVA